MQQDADFITAVLYVFRASCTHHQEYKKILTRQPPVLVVMAADGSSLHHISFGPNMAK